MAAGHSNVGAIVKTKSGDVHGMVIEDLGRWWRVEWDDGKTTTSDADLLRAFGHVVKEAESDAR